MAKGFINADSVRKAMTENVIPNSAKTLINNPYYLFNDKTASISNYYNLNTTMTTLDEATKGNYGELTANSPLRFNKIIGFYIFGIEKINPSLDINEYGLEGENIDGEAIILPNTVVPYPGDRFTLNQLGDKYIFQVTNVNPNTLDTGSIMYKIGYSLCGSDGIQSIEDKVVKTFKFVATNIGTNFASIIEESTYDKVSELQSLYGDLQDYFMQLFYDTRIQTIAYYRDAGGFKVHDPYLLEFIIKNELMNDDIYLDHQLYLPATFGIEYDRTIFSTIENCDIKHHIGKYTGNILLVTQKLSLLYAYPQDYYYMDYSKMYHGFYIIDIFDDPEFGDKIKSNIRTGNAMKDILIEYLNGSDPTDEQIEALRHIDFMNGSEQFYLIPITLFILNKYISKFLSKTSE